MGLINNAAYVIMIAGANEIAASAVGLVYFCAIFPTILVKLTAPYWFHLVGYTPRFWVAACLMACSFCVVALGTTTSQQLLGVGLAAVQGGLGEASTLGLCSLYPNQLALTAWSSGTGFAGERTGRLHEWSEAGLLNALPAAASQSGIFGYAWVAALHYWVGYSFKVTLLLANVLPGLWLAVFHLMLSHHGAANVSLSVDAEGGWCCQPSSNSDGVLHSRPSPPVDAASMTFRQRMAATARLWPYMVPLFVVYFAEYAMQSGTWTAIGFPVTSADARHIFYLYANWTYQAGQRSHQHLALL
eukprot:gene8201-8392_t